MKKIVFFGALVTGISVPGFSYADTHSQVGAGYHGSNITESSTNYDVDFSSPVFSARVLPSIHFAIETNYYMAGGGKYTLGSDSGSSSFDTSGLELNLLFGTNMVDQGAYAYAGVGYFSETWKSNSSSNKYNASGLQAPVGVGYNFGNFSVDLQYVYRNPDAYVGQVFSNGSDVDASVYQLRFFSNL
jgi:hypothetical protein